MIGGKTSTTHFSLWLWRILFKERQTVLIITRIHVLHAIHIFCIGKTIETCAVKGQTQGANLYEFEILTKPSL